MNKTFSPAVSPSFSLPPFLSSLYLPADRLMERWEGKGAKMLDATVSAGISVSTLSFTWMREMMWLFSNFQAFIKETGN